MNVDTTSSRNIPKELSDQGKRGELSQPTGLGLDVSSTSHPCQRERI